MMNNWELEPNLPNPKWFILWVLIFIVVTMAWVLALQPIARAETASYYTYQSCVREGTSGVWTANGERYNENDLTCALRSRDFGGIYKVTNIENGKSVIVRHNDFGPNKKLWNKGRKIDLSKGAFQKIASLKKGIINVKIEKVN